MHSLWLYKLMDVQELVTVEIPEEKSEIGEHISLVVRSINMEELSDTMMINLDNKRRNGKLMVIASFALVCAFYGGMHLSILGFDFPSSVERLLWKISCFITIAGSLFMPKLILSAEKIFGKEASTNIAKLLRFHSGLSDLWCLLAIISSPFLLAARLYLLVESSVSLHNVPAGLYVTVQWTQYLPHF
ncbi:hypothetical protein FPQ18DRAFT_68480 [Pyronema domesticum]|nr:hypothetical protein FPQ18DRAFT_68480 [Pyronema domesticum]